MIKIYEDGEVTIYGEDPVYINGKLMYKHRKFVFKSEEKRKEIMKKHSKTVSYHENNSGYAKMRSLRDNEEEGFII